VLEQITPLIITWNEAANIGRTLDKLLWARRIVVIDSGSTDETIDILGRYPQVEVIQHPFTDAASQCNFGLSRIDSTWVLSLDADYELSDELVRELELLAPTDHVSGFQTRFVYRVHGRALRGTLYPPRTVLYRRERARYRNAGHAQRVVIDGNVLPLREVIFHDDRKPLARWFATQRRYAEQEAEYLLRASRDTLRRTDKIRLMAWPAPIAVFLYSLIVKGCILDGWPGWYYMLQRVVAEMMIALEIIEQRLRRNESN
jgi:glycosyltransferase involved in cell wall biosynthesis